MVLVLRATSFFNSVFAQSALTLDLGSGFQGMLLPNTQIPIPVDRSVIFSHKCNISVDWPHVQCTTYLVHILNFIP